MNTIDFSPLYRSSIGFDRLAALLDSSLRADASASGYPPYNIEVLDDERYAISLAVAGILIMNVMLVSVSERTREVGLLKALGVGRRQILSVFLAEAALISSLGGVVGLAIGWLGVRLLVGLYPAFPGSPTAWAVGPALAVSLGVGITFGLLPARRASRLDPVLALAGR